MAQYVSFEGTQDYLIHFPALIMTFVSSGSITAGNAVGLGTDGNVYAIGVTASAAEQGVRAAEFIGIATKTVATAKKLPVIVWGPVKNIVGQVAITPGQRLVPSGSTGRLGPMSLQGTSESNVYSSLGYSGSLYCGRAISTGVAAGTFNALIRGF